MAKTEQVPPSNLDAEESVLGAMLLSAKAIDAVVGEVSAQDFYRASHGRIFSSAMALHEAGDPVDAITVAAKLGRDGLLEEAGGPERIHEIAALVPAAGNAKHYAKIVRDTSLLRGLVNVGGEIQRLGWDAAGEPRQLLDQAEEKMFALAATGDRGDLVSLDESMDETFRHIQEAYETGASHLGIETGFDTVDGICDGLLPGNLVVVAARPSMGKALRMDANVLTPTGWCRNGDLRVGDEIIGADGKTDMVTGVYDQGERALWRLVLADGSSVDCTSEHLWLTRTRNERRRRHRGQVRETHEIAETLTRADGYGWNHSIPYVSPVEFGHTAEISLDPYWLGLYLGDGASSGGGVVFTNPETDLLEAFARLLPADDEATSRAHETCPTIGVRRRRRNGRPSETLRVLRELGLASQGSADKFIPKPLLFGSVDQRISLLQGLCDTDGYVTDPGGACIEISTVSARMRDGILFLVQSLGGRATSTTTPAYYTVDGERRIARDAHRIVVSFPAGGVTPVRSEKHMRKWRGGPHRRGRERMIVSVEPAGYDECRCITVARGLYVTDGFVVTHNSAFAAAVIRNVARKHGPVGLFTMEMSREEVNQRLLAIDSLVDLKKIRTGRLDREEWKRVVDSRTRLGELPVYVDDSGLITALELRSKARRLRLRHKNLALVVVDYIQLMNSGVESDQRNRVQEVSRITRSLKVLARELEVPVLALSQLSRAVEQRHDKRPILSDLRESGSIEQDADVVMFLYREEYYEQEDPDVQGLAEVHVAKQRNGPTGVAKLAFVGRYARFSQLPKGGDYRGDD